MDGAEQVQTGTGRQRRQIQYNSVCGVHCLHDRVVHGWFVDHETVHTCSLWYRVNMWRQNTTERSWQT